MTDKNNTLYVTAEQEQLDALRITLGMRMKLSEWDLVQDALSGTGVSGIAVPMREMIARLTLALRTSHDTVPNPPHEGEDTPHVSAAFDSDDLNELHVLMKFTYMLRQWRGLKEQLTGIHRNDPTDRMYDALVRAMAKLNAQYTVELVGTPDNPRAALQPKTDN